MASLISTTHHVSSPLLLSPPPRFSPNPKLTIVALHRIPTSPPSLSLSKPFKLDRLLLTAQSATSAPFSSAVDSLLILCTSLALALSLFVADVDSAAAFVVAPPQRKLQTDELATVRLFQENTPSVVYITNLAARQDAFTLDVPSKLYFVFLRKLFRVVKEEKR